MQKKIIAILTALILLAAGCSGGKGAEKPEETKPSTGTAAVSSEPTAAAIPEETAAASPETEAAETETELPAEEPEPDGEYSIPCGDLQFANLPEDNCRVFYEIFVGSFSDSDGDGTGDLRGIINRMDYLNDGNPASGCSLGVEGIWLTPIFKSPTYHKYDVTDYYTVDPAFGTENDLEELIELCHERDVKIIIDLPINHTGSLNAWFGEFKQAHRKGDTDNPYYEFYSYYRNGETPPAGRSFAQLSGTDDYYECNFSGDMPELNYDNDAVREAVLDVARYYLNLGIDGFRFDAAKYIYYGDHTRSGEFWEWYTGELRAINPDIYIIAEVWDGDGTTDKYYPFMNCFNFTTSQAEGLIATTAKAGDVSKFTGYVEKYMTEIKALNPDAMYVPFISNHDMDRCAGYLTAASGQMKVAASLYLLSPGSPFIYYGEEIGLRGSRGGASTDANRRLAMVWGDGDSAKDPTGANYGAALPDSSVQLQLSDANSLLTHYKNLLMIRKANPEIARGEYSALRLKDTKLGGFSAEWNGNTVCVLHNTTTRTLTCEISDLGVTVSGITATAGAGTARIDGTALIVEGQTSVILR